MKLFAGTSNRSLAENIAKAMGESLSPLEVFTFADGERRIRILESVVDANAVIIQSTANPAEANYMELFFIANALLRAGAKSITAVIPYLGYQRQDHVFRDGEAVSLEVIVNTLEAVGIQNVITLDLHSVRISEAFKIPVSHLSALTIFAEVIKKNGWNSADTVLVSPDKGGTRRIKMLSELLNDRKYAVVEKSRDLDTGKVVAMNIEGQLGKRAIIVDDMITSGATVLRTAELLEEKGVEEILVFATHGIFVDRSSALMQESAIQKVFLTDTVPVGEEKKIEKLEILSVAEIVAEELRKFLILIKNYS